MQRALSECWGCFSQGLCIHMIEFTWAGAAAAAASSVLHPLPGRVTGLTGSEFLFEMQMPLLTLPLEVIWLVLFLTAVLSSCFRVGVWGFFFFPSAYIFFLHSALKRW